MKYIDKVKTKRGFKYIKKESTIKFKVRSLERRTKKSVTSHTKKTLITKMMNCPEEKLSRMFQHKKSQCRVFRPFFKFLEEHLPLKKQTLIRAKPINCCR